MGIDLRTRIEKGTEGGRWEVGDQKGWSSNVEISGYTSCLWTFN